MKEKLLGLVGCKVIEVFEFTGSFDEGYVIVFDNGKMLTAQDGEYGDNAFVFLNEEDLKEKDTIIRY